MYYITKLQSGAAKISQEPPDEDGALYFMVEELPEGTGILQIDSENRLYYSNPPVEEDPDTTAPPNIFEMQENIGILIGEKDDTLDEVEEEIDAPPPPAILERKRQLAVSVGLTQAIDVAALSFVLMAQSDLVDEVTITENSSLFPVWDERWTGKAGTILQDEGKLYKSIHDIGAGQNTKPSTTPSMWSLIGNPAEEYPEWIQPFGAHDAYSAGAKVTHSKKRWINSHGDGNIWEPGVWGWTVV